MELDEAEKMVALKKAYAEIILNTAKEAAARVMVSERKAHRFQLDLFAAKEEALRMLVRLKQMIDSKTTEAEKTSLSQRGRIEELEGQLEEAEEIITDLRIELKQVQEELGKVKMNQVQPLSGRKAQEDVCSAKNTTAEDTLNTSEPVRCSPDSGLGTADSSDLKNTLLNQRILNNKCCNATTKTEQLSISHLENYYGQNSDIGSIIMRNKKPELYRNGCTQRIHAFGVDGKLLPSGDADDQHSLIKNELMNKLTDKDEGQCTTSLYKTRNTKLVKNSYGEDIKKPVKVRALRRRKTRFGKCKGSSCRSRPGKLTKPDQLSTLSHFKTYSVNGNAKSDREGCSVPSTSGHNADMIKNSTCLEEKLQHYGNCCEDEVLKNVSKGKRERQVKCREAIATSFRSLDQLADSCQSSPFLSHCKTYTLSVNGNVNSAEDQLNMNKIEDKMKPLPCWDPGLILIKSNVDPISGSTNVTVSVKTVNKTGLVQNPADSNREWINESMVVKHAGGTEESSKVPGSELNIDMVDVPLINSESKDAVASESTNRRLSQANSNRLLTYTSRRKRKEDSMKNPDEEAPPLKRSTQEKQNNAPEPQKSSFIYESSRDSRRLAQVARQLISLSGKRWW